MNTLFALITLLIAAALQAWLPTLWWLGGVRLEFLPVLVACAALTLRRRSALAFALAAGLLQDALSAAPFGLSALAYGIATVILTGMREALDHDLAWVQLGAGAFTSAAASIAALCVVGVSLSALLKLLLLAGMSGVAVVFILPAAGYRLLAAKQ